VSKFKKQKIIVTSALPYANGPIHVGHLVEYIQTDIFVRFLKLTGKDAVYLCADDTHGTPIEIKAKQEGVKPEEFIARWHKEHTKDFDDFLIRFDSYYSTNSKENKYFSDLIFERLNKKNLIYKKNVEITYCENCKRSLPDRFVKGKCPKCNAPDQYGDVCEKCSATYKTTELIEPYCVVCRKKPIRKKSEHYFFKLSAFSDKLKKWFDKNKKLQSEIKNYLYNWIKQGLEEWDITRDGPYFGFKIPGEKDKYYYVWLDAPIGYISSLANYLGRDVKKAEKVWNDSEIIHFIGKDIIYFHFLFWPAVLWGAGFEIPDYLVVHGFLTVKKEKMSKSRGTLLTAKEYLENNNPEHLRFYYAKNLSRKVSDINLDFDDLKDSVNNELAANIGNFCFRVLSFLEKNFDGKIKDIEKDTKLINEINKKIKIIEKNYSEVNYNIALKEIMNIGSLGNKYFQDSQPWALIKEDGSRENAHKIVGLCANIVKNLSILLSPILPKFSSELQKQLNLNVLKWDDINFKLKNHKIGKVDILVKRVEEKKEEKEKFPLDLRIAEIISVEEHPDADKLLIMKIDLGAEKRQIVAGIKKYYKKEELIGKRIVIVANLKYAKLRGYESQGMLLAGDDGKNIGLLHAEKSEPGSRAYFEGLENGSKEISFDDFKKIEMAAKGRKVFYKGRQLKTDKEEIRAEKVSDSARIC